MNAAAGVGMCVGYDGEPGNTPRLILSSAEGILHLFASLFYLPPPQELHDPCRTAMSWGKLLALASSCALFVQSALAVTVYGQEPLGATKTLQPGSTYTGLPAYDPTTLTPPVISPLPSPYFLQLTNDVTAVGGVSIPMQGTFVGFSIEVSVVNQICEFFRRSSSVRKKNVNSNLERSGKEL